MKTLKETFKTEVKGMAGSLIDVLIGVVLFSALIGSIITSLTAARNNMTGAAAIVMDIIPILLAIGVLIWVGKKFGVVGGCEN